MTRVHYNTSNYIKPTTLKKHCLISITKSDKSGEIEFVKETIVGDYDL
ncbi:hypothetical protein CCACVL1_04697 [Corchorus capsularis]|uniref:Uncharacterized protein n=1 Tax=Corchorus capsularis TaxID=210143 RepID=A0A1R3JQA7_COCAP|nr:hypothetical protein CCACVL1_04697 [Corchorus capsularis]